MHPRGDGSFALFGEESFHAITQAQLQSLKEHIEGEDPAYLLNVNTNEYVEHVTEGFQIDPLIIDIENPALTVREENRQAQRSNIYTGARPGDSFSCQVFTYHLTVTGNPNLLRCQPNPRSICGHRVYFLGGDICFDVVDQGNAETVRTEANRTLQCMRDNLKNLAQNIASFNQTLREQANYIFQKRRSELQQRVSVVEALGIPLKRAGAIPATLAVPITRKNIPAPRTSEASQPYKREFTLDESIYQEILRIVHDTGRVFERLPSTYAGKDEETLRDHLILQLEPHFEWSSTTSETFNKKGKTDILIRFEKEIVFVAECKFWRGRKQHFETIDQILKYLTWRESKTAIIYFVDTKEISAPLQMIQSCTPEHPCFLAFKGEQEKSQFHYEFHLPGDKERIVRTAILCFHIPKP